MKSLTPQNQKIKSLGNTVVHAKAGTPKISKFHTNNYNLLREQDTAWWKMRAASKQRKAKFKYDKYSPTES